MRLVEFPEQTVVIARKQPEYRPMPAHVSEDGNIVTSCWSPSLTERLKILFTGRLWLQAMTFRSPLQPQLLSVAKPELR
jgi:hypothetical protein